MHNYPERRLKDVYSFVMLKRTLLPFLLAGLLNAQTVADVISLIDSARAAQTVVLSLTASQGDGTKAVITKFAGSKISFGLKLTPGDGVTSLTQMNLGGSAAVQTMTWGYGDLLCLLAWNPTASAVTLGSLASVPAASLAWSCSTNISAGGVVSGQTAPVTGTVSWP